MDFFFRTHAKKNDFFFIKNANELSFYENINAIKIKQFFEM